MEQIIFRASGGNAPGKDFGMGHVYRCLNLAEKLQDYSILFLMENYQAGVDVVRSRGYDIKVTPVLSAPQEEISALAEASKETKPEFIIIDKYKMPDQVFSAARQLKSKVIAISDLDRIDLDADIVIDGFIGLSSGEVKNKYGAKCYVGPKYAIIDENFRNVFPAVNYNLLITTGGFDHHHLNLKLIEAIDLLRGDKGATVILGPASDYGDKLEKILAKTSKAIDVKKAVASLAPEIQKASFGICAGGMTTYEFACAGLPYAILAQEEHQLQTAKIWEKLGVAMNLGLGTELTAEHIAKQLDSLLVKKKKLKNMSEKGREIVDGRGVLRVKDIIQNANM